MRKEVFPVVLIMILISHIVIIATTNLQTYKQNHMIHKLSSKTFRHFETFLIEINKLSRMPQEVL